MRATAADQQLVQLIGGQSVGTEREGSTPGHCLMFIDLQKLQSETESSQVGHKQRENRKLNNTLLWDIENP